MRKKLLITILILIFLYCIGGIIYSVFIKTNNSEIIDKKIIEIRDFEYKIDENLVSSLYINEFKQLKDNLESAEINYDKYIESISKLYIIDLYTLKDKLNKYDVTSSQYVFGEVQDNFKLKVNETLYKYIEDNSDNKRDQELPLVSEVIIKNVENTTYLINDVEFEAYNVNIEWLYEKDFGYDTSAILTLIKKDNVISVVEEKRIEVTLENDINT